jgi:hypothetical protein
MKQQQQQHRHAVALVSDFFFPRLGGVENHIWSLAHALLALGHKVREQCVGVLLVWLSTRTRGKRVFEKMTCVPMEKEKLVELCFRLFSQKLPFPFLFAIVFPFF